MADLHPLDRAFDAYWRHPMSRPPLDDLMAAVRTEALRITRDQDAAQEVCVVVLETLDRFVRADATAFSRWIRRIARIRRLSMIPKGAARITDQMSIDFDYGSDDDCQFADFQCLPTDIRPIALALSFGDSMDEIAERLGVKPRSLQKKVERFRRKIDHSFPLYIEAQKPMIATGSVAHRPDSMR